MRMTGLKRICFYAAILLMSFFGTGVGAGEIPEIILYQDSVRSISGDQMNGNFSMTFSLYDSPMGATALWSETQKVEVREGFYEVLLGSVLPITLSFDMPYFVGVRVGERAEILPRQPLHSVGYAFYAARAEAVSGGGITDQSISDTAGIATAKLSGPVTAIQDHGLGEMALKDTVGFTDINQNGCSAGQVIRRSADNRRWECGSVDGTFPESGLITTEMTARTATQLASMDEAQFLRKAMPGVTPLQSAESGEPVAPADMFAAGGVTLSGSVIINADKGDYDNRPAFQIYDTHTSDWTPSPNRKLFEISTGGGLVLRNVLGVGFIPETGCGERMMWHPFKSAFRAGGLSNSGKCDYWDDASTGFYSWAGGFETKASSNYSFAFGDNVTVSGPYAAAFGGSSTVSGTAGFSAGASNTCSGFTCIAMGNLNKANGSGSVAIGTRVNAIGNYTVALGNRARTGCISGETDCITPYSRTGSFIFGDNSTTSYMDSVQNNEVAFRAEGGFRFRTHGSLATGCNLPAGSGTFNCGSSRTLKENFVPVDGGEILAQISILPITIWNFIEEGEKVRHIGPVAEDFHAAFGFGTDDISIPVQDLAGVNMAAIQALVRENDELKSELNDMKSRMERIERLLAAGEIQLR
jgi:trimeric autotransporter adhesin